MSEAFTGIESEKSDVIIISCIVFTRSHKNCSMLEYIVDVTRFVDAPAIIAISATCAIVLTIDS